MTAPVFPRVALMAAMLLLLWRVLQVNAVIYGDDNQPSLRIAAESTATEASLRAALRDNPGDVGALLALASERARAGDSEGARRAHAAALEIAPIDAVALRAAAVDDLAAGRSGDAITRLDRLVSLYPEEREWIFPELARILPGAAQFQSMEALAARQSPWMGAFIEFTCTRDVDPRLAGGLLMRRAAAGYARVAEVACVTDRLRRAGHFETAYQVWLNSLARERLAEVGFVFNGGFEFAPSGAGFDWIADAQAHAQAVEYPVADSGVPGRRALRVTYTGKRVGVPAIQQHLAVAAGKYELRGRVRLESLQSVRGLQWIVRCDAPQGATLGTSRRLLGSNEWEPFAFEVEVPSACPGQVLALEPVGLYEGTTYVAGKAWFDDLRLAKVR
jgi:hypothetical protein